MAMEAAMAMFSLWLMAMMALDWWRRRQ